MRSELLHARVVKVLTDAPSSRIYDDTAYIEEAATAVVETVLDYIIEQLPPPVGEVGE